MPADVLRRGEVVSGPCPCLDLKVITLQEYVSGREKNTLIGSGALYVRCNQCLVIVCIVRMARKAEEPLVRACATTQRPL